MRNKNTFKQFSLLAVLLPFFVFSVALANQGEESEELLKANANQKAKVELRKEIKADLKTNAELKTAREENKEERKERMQERKDGRRAKRATVIKNVMESQIARATKAFDRLSLILDKIEAKSKEMPAGANMTQVNALITKAVTQEAGIKVSLDKAQADFEAMSQTKVEETSDEEPSTVEPVKEAKQAVKTFMTTMRDLKNKLTELHKTEREIVKAMRAAAKAVRPSDDVEAEVEVETSTEASTSNN